jgi:beta-galactosidase
MWEEVTYAPGSLRVVALDKAGNALAEKEVKTAGRPHALVLKADRKVLRADGKDLAFVTVSVIDKEGNPCPTATHQLSFKVRGRGSFRAACNGDATSLEPFHLPTMKLFSGKLVVIVQSDELPGDMVLEVTGKGLKKGIIDLRAN